MVASGGFAVGFAAAMVAVMAGVTVNVVEIQTFIAQNGAQNGCLPDPCENGGTCTRLDRLGGYSCACTSGYTGTTCSESVTVETGVFSLHQPKLNLLDTAGTREGSSVDVSGDGLRIVVGAVSYSSPVAGFGMFSVYSRSGAGENFTDESGVLQGTTGGSNETSTNMGFCTAIDYDGNTLVVSGPRDGTGNQGAVWVFTRTGSTWTQQGAKLTPNVTSGEFGSRCDISDDGDTLVAALRRSGVGELHVYTRSGETWSPHASNPITPTDAVDPESVHCLSLSGDGSTIVAGMYTTDNDGIQSGAAFVFTDNGTAWVQQGAYLNASISKAGAQLGIKCSVSYNGDVMAIGIVNGTGLVNAGAVAVYNRTGETWTEVAIVRSETPEAEDYFATVALSANATVMAIGAYEAGASDYGVVEVFSSDGDPSVWTKVGDDLEPTGSVGDPAFGAFQVSIDATGSAIAATGSTDDSNKGAAWVFSNE